VGRVGLEEDPAEHAVGEPLVVRVPPESVEVFAVVAGEFELGLAVDFALKKTGWIKVWGETKFER